MDIGEVVEQLAFGKSEAKVSSCLGLYLSPEVVYLADVHLKAGRLAVDHLVRVPVPVSEATKEATLGTLTTVNADFLASNAKLVEALKQAMAQKKWSSRNVMVTLSHHLGLLRYFTMPAVDRRYWRTAVPFEAKKYLPLSFDGLNHDFQVVPLPPDSGGKARQGALLAVSPKKVIASISALLEGMGLRVAGVEVAPCSVIRLWESLDKRVEGKPYCHVHFDGGNIRILVADKGLPVFFREVFLGAEAPVKDARKVDLGGCVSFAQKQFAVDNLLQARVSGTTAALASWQETFSQELGLKTIVQDPAAGLGLKSGDWGAYAAVGASARFVAPGKTVLDLARVGKISEEERRTARAIFAAAGVLALALAASGLWRGLVYAFHARELSQYQRDPEIEAIFQGRGAAEVEKLLRDMQEESDALEGLDDSPTMALPVLKDLVDALPTGVWLTRISLASPVPRALTRLPMEIDLGGNASAASVSQEQDLALQYKDKLGQSALLNRLGASFEATVTRAGGAEELRTAFTISAKAKR